MSMAMLGVLPGLLFGLTWLGVMIYLLVLGTRFVNAVERIADKMGTEPRA